MLEIDEESRFVELRADRTALGGADVILSIWRKYAAPVEEGRGRLLFVCRTDRLRLALEFAHRLQRWLREDFRPDEIDLFLGRRLDNREAWRLIRERLDLRPLFAKLPRRRCVGNSP